MNVPRATYRLQFNRAFTFADAAALVPYLHTLGISHVYASPFLKARVGSQHGYDIVDHAALNPEIGSDADFAAYSAALRRHDMGQILDIVPNHMGVGNDNRWWLDVLEHGAASAFAAYFDIDWKPVNPALRDKVLLPLLGDQYGEVLERGELELRFSADAGEFSLHYYEHCVPIDVQTYPLLLESALRLAESQPGVDADAVRELRAVSIDCAALPARNPHDQDVPAAADEVHPLRGELAAACRLRLAGICGEYPVIRLCIERSVIHCNGIPNDPDSFDMLHELLEAQAYRLSYWRVAVDEINYRRFFDINDLAGLRMDNAKVFEATHERIRQLVADGHVHGLRVDHVDGLSDPLAYCRNLQTLLREAQTGTDSADGYVVVEKILASYEHPPADWPVAGTTGYEVAYLLNGLFVYPGALRQLSRIYARFAGDPRDFDEILYASKKLIIHGALSSELTVLGNLASAAARADRHTRDFTYQRLREALADIVACFPVYRTYITPERISEDDRRYLHWAIAQARKRSAAADVQVFDFLQRLLSLDFTARHEPAVRRLAARLITRFQQYTAPVMAKGMEDTAFYGFNRLAALNDVGFNPRLFGISAQAFHLENRHRIEHWPHTLIATSTHDSKRSEDVRARIDVLSEIAHEWQHHLARWSRFNLNKKRLVGEQRVPSRNDEYLLYQTLVGTWPLDEPDPTAFDAYRERIQSYMLKAIREAKTHTSWINPNEEYEAAMQHFVAALLDPSGRNPFLADFVPFQRRMARFGLLNGLSQTLLKFTVPGVPDVYQGNEVWCFSLADPDNRRAVDFRLRQSLLDSMRQATRDGARLHEHLKQWLDRAEDGRIKLYLTWKTLHLRRALPELFAHGSYIGLETEGTLADHLCAFARQYQGQEVIVVVARWFARLAAGHERVAVGSPVWDETFIHCPEGDVSRVYRNALTEEPVAPRARDDAHGCVFAAADVLRNLPVGLLVRE